MKIKILVWICTFLFLYSANAQTTGIRGVITYYFNDYQGNKPDLGATVHAIESTNKSFDPLLMDSFLVIKTNMALYKSYENMTLNYFSLSKNYEKKKKDKLKYDEFINKAKQMENEALVYKNELVKYGIDNDKKFDEFCKKVGNQYYLLNLKQFPSATVDGSGNYSISLKPQIYYILIVSKNRKDMNFAELLGKIYYQKVTIKEGEVIDVSRNFDLYN